MTDNNERTVKPDHSSVLPTNGPRGWTAALSGVVSLGLGVTFFWVVFSVASGFVRFVVVVPALAFSLGGIRLLLIWREFEPPGGLHERLNAANPRLRKWIWKVALIAVVMVAPYLLATGGGRLFVREHWLLGLAYGALMTALTVGLATQARLDERLAVWPKTYLFAIFVGLVLLTIGSFASLSFALADGGIVEYPISASELHGGALADAYLWHFADLVPVLGIPETLGWENRVESDTTATGALVLLFQGVTIFLLLPIWSKWPVLSFGSKEPTPRPGYVVSE